MTTVLITVECNETAHIIRYEIIDIRTNEIVATTKSRSTAGRIIDRKDLRCGTYRHIARAIWSN
jgi:hypothetical protein